MLKKFNNAKVKLKFLQFLKYTFLELVNNFYFKISE